jgi:hypothetical protein
MDTELPRNQSKKEKQEGFMTLSMIKGRQLFAWGNGSNHGNNLIDVLRTMKSGLSEIVSIIEHYAIVFRLWTALGPYGW